MKRSMITVAVLVLSGCSGGSSNPNPDGGGDGGGADAPGPDAAAPQTVLEQTVGSAGGVLEVPGRLRIEIPAGALAQDTRITVTESTASPTPGVAPAGPLLALAPDLTFALPVTLTFTPAAASASLAETSAGFVVLRRRQTDPDFLPVASAPPGATTVTARTTHFSTWLLALVERVGCAVPESACMEDGCTPESAGPNGCPATCRYRSQDQSRALSCTRQSGGALPVYACACTGAMARAFTLEDVALGEPVAQYLAHRCGIGCAGPDGGAPDGGAVDGGADGAAASGPRSECMRYFPAGDPTMFPPRNVFVRTLQVFDGRVWWATDAAYAQRVHSVALDLSDYRAIPDQVGVFALAANRDRILWMNQHPTAGGLYHVLRGQREPVRAGPAPPAYPFALLANDTHLFYAVNSAGRNTLYRASLDGTNEESYVSDAPSELLLDADGSIWGGRQGSSVTTSFCAQATPRDAVVERYPASGDAPASSQVVVRACDVLRLVDRLDTVFGKLALDQTTVFFTTTQGDLLAAPRAGGAVRLLYREARPGVREGASRILLTGTHVVWISPTQGLVRLPKGATTATTPEVLDAGLANATLAVTQTATHFYWANYEQVCRVRLD